MRPRKRDRHLPPCVYLRHGSYYFVRRGKWIRLGSSLSDALSRYARLVSANSETMAGLIDATIEDARAKGRSKNTLAQYELAGRHLKSALVEFAVDQVEPHHIGTLMDHFSDRPNMANRMRTVLKLAFAKAVRRGLRRDNPVHEIQPFTERKRTRHITDEEWHAIYKEASPALRCIMDIAYHTGQRISDVLAIRLSDVTDEGIYFEPSKTKQHGKKLLVSATPALREAVSRCRGLFRTTPMYLVGQRNGRIRSYYAARDLLRRAAERAGVKDIGWHDIRARSLTDAEAQGLDAQALGAHSSRQQTERYLRGRKVMVVEGPASFGHSKTSGDSSGQNA